MLSLMRRFSHHWTLLAVCVVSQAASARADSIPGHTCQLVAGLARPRVLYRLADRADRLALALPKNFASALAPLPVLRDTFTSGPIDPAAALPAAAASEPAAASSSTNSARGWWIVAGASVVVVAGIIVAAVVLGSSATRTPQPVRGNVGGTVQTLGAP